VSIASTAQSIVGCGTTGVTSIITDLLSAFSWNASSSSYIGDDPFGSVTSVVLTANNSGIGTFDLLTTNGGNSIGTYYSLTGPGYGTSTDGITLITPTPTDNANCTACINAIASLDAQITTLRNSCTTPITLVNLLKTERIEYEIQRYGYNKSVKYMQDENVRVGIALNILNDPTYDAII
jgi:hypothetical protein